MATGGQQASPQPVGQPQPDSNQAIPTVARFYQVMWLNVAGGVALTLLTGQFAPQLLGIALPIGLLWCLAPLLMSWLSRQPVRKVFSPNQEQKQLLRQTSREIWAFLKPLPQKKKTGFRQITTRNTATNGGPSYFPYQYWPFPYGKPDCWDFGCKRAARTVLTGMCYSVGSATRQGSSSLTRFIGQSAMTLRT